MTDAVAVKRALISVSDKTDLVPFARRLVRHGVQLISTGGTAAAIEEAGIEVTPVDQVTGFPEMMDGRVKTLHPAIHGGLLGLRDDEKHVTAMREHGIEPIDLVCVNLYPFEQTVAREDVAEAEAIEQIDIGGPSMLRSAAKNHRFVAVVTDPAQYDRLVNEMDAHDGATTFALRRALAQAAFARTAAYDTAIAEWMASALPDFPDNLLLRFERHPVALRYGENPHQAGALYLAPRSGEPSIAASRQLHGMALSYCNIFDADGALELVKEIDPARRASAAVIKHANPCGFAVADDLPTAFERAYDGDPLAAFGGIVALNRKVDDATAQKIAEGKKFLHVIVAPEFDDDALERLKDRWKDVRLLAVGPLAEPGQRRQDLDMRRVTGGLLVQRRDLASFPAEPDWQHAAGPAPDADLVHELSLAMICVKHLKSNAICLVNDAMLVGAGAGQMDRLASTRIAIEKAGDRARGAVAGSDAFFPFRDGPDQLIDAGVRAIVQPGGSKNDEQTIEACNEAGVCMMFTGRRHFRH
ncbi:MAG: bifunctional phosphoribosylaminoimidazolecarboxamide formyltransferase/inosine monophosphate cyclohydrolase [Phycisphaeraceae bacterium]|nr:bifunctional phosphoribosylaminoimidazolecarboxamide formyltransferase/inosine monophosphate cyclohydrolase [Phycisphaeraceae bacterium]